MKEIIETANNIKRLEAFLKNIKMNFNDHKKTVIAKDGRTLDDICNSLAFLKDYNEVTNELVKVMENYDMKTSGEIRF